MLGIFGKLLGTDKAVDDILDSEKGLLTKFGGWVDEQQYTDEEKEKARLDVRTWGVAQLKALEPFKVVQRILAFAAALLWIIVALNVVVAIWIGDDNITKAMLEFALSDYIFWPVLSVFGLYFSGGVVDSIRRPKQQ